MQAAGGVDDEHVAPESPGLGQPLARDVDRARRLAEHGHVDLLAEHPQLLDCGGPLQVGADEQRMPALLLEPAGQLGRRGRLARPLQAGHQHDGRVLRRVGDLEVLAAEGVDQLVVDDLDDLLGRAQALGQVEPDGLLLDASDNPLDHAEVDVGLEEGEADLAQDLVDLLLAQPPPAAQALEDPLEPIGECVEHRRGKATTAIDLRRPDSHSLR